MTTSVCYRIGTLFDEKGSSTAVLRRISDALNKQFQSIFISQLENIKIRRPDELCSTSNLQEKRATINYSNITKEGELSTIDEINVKSATGKCSLSVYC